MKFRFAAVLIICLLATGSQVLANTQSRDTWRSIRTNNLFVVGNASEEDLRQVALWLEFFHSTFGRLMSRPPIDYSVPTTVIIFKDDATFHQFKPLYQGRPANVVGYFQPGLDTNYIAFSLEGSRRGLLRTAFHEYVHLYLRDSHPGVPVWLNEGLAEFYGSLAHANNEAVLGVPIPFYMRLLDQGELIHLSDLFSINSDSPHYNERDKSGIFYAESWALVHYLMLGDGGRRQLQFKTFLDRVSSGDETAKVIESVFGLTLEALEKEFLAYLTKGEFPTQRVNVGISPQAYMAMQRSALSDGEANFYLGDLLMHIHREAEAETYFKRAISEDPGFTPTYASLGLLSVRQNRYAEARKYLERATGSSQSHLIHYLYAFVLSREGMTPDGNVKGYSPENARIMREELRKAIKLAPDFADAYYLLAFVNLVTNEQLDEAVSLVRQAQKLDPSKPAYPFLLAQIHLRRKETEAARDLLERLARQNADPEVRTSAQSLLDSLGTTDNSEPRRGSEKVEGSAMLVLDNPLPKPRTITVGPLPETAIRDGQTIESSGSLPSVDDVLKRYVQAIGGENALSSAKTRVIKGTVNIIGVSRGGTIELYAKPPNKTLTIMRAHPIGLVKMGFNGIAGWAQLATGFRVVKGPELIALQRDSDFYNPLTLRSHYPKIRLLGTSKIGYRQVYVLELQPPAGPPEKLYLDATTYLPVRVNVVRSVAGRPAVPMEIYFDDWREVDGIKIPFGLTQALPGMTLGITLNEIKHNVPLDDSLFEKPTR
jgi:tetratricopeptide (TPR) repeat protein